MNKFIKLFIAALLWACCIFSLHDHSRQISGLTIASDCIGLTRASMAVKGTAHVIVSDPDGHDALTVPNDQAVLMISYIGFPPQEISAGDHTNTEIVFLVTGA